MIAGVAIPATAVFMGGRHKAGHDGPEMKMAGTSPAISENVR
jgi:hypothetical protein